MSQDEARRSAIAKAGRRLLPFLCLCYAVNFLDRVNVGFAALAMNDDLGFSAVGVRRRRRHLLRRLYPVRGAEQPGAAEIRRAHLDRAHHDQLGPGLHRHGPRQRRAELLCDALSVGRRRSRLLPGHHLYFTYWFPARNARASSRCSWRRCRWPPWSGPGLRRAARDARPARAEGLALAVHRRGTAGGHPGRGRAVLDRPARDARWLSQDERTALAGTLAARGHERRDKPAMPTRPGADAAARAGARLPLFLHRHRLLRRELLAAAGDPDLRANSAADRLPHRDPVLLSRPSPWWPVGRAFRPHRRAHLARGAARCWLPAWPSPGRLRRCRSGSSWWR